MTQYNQQSKWTILQLRELAAI